MQIADKWFNGHVYEDSGLVIVYLSLIECGQICRLAAYLFVRRAVRVLPAACRYRLNAAPPKIFSFTKIMDNSTKIASIELAINDLNRQLILNFRGTAKKYGLVESTLRRRFKGQTVLIKAARAATH